MSTRRVWWSPILHECPPDPERGGWLMSPTHHAIEVVLTLALASLVFRFAWRRFTHQLKAMAHLVVPPSPQSWRAVWFDRVLFTTMLVSIGVICIHKWIGHKMWFLLQPCHVLHVLLLVIFMMPRGTGIGALLFSYYLHLLWAPLLGLVAADLACYTLPFELFNWFLQHSMLLIVPLIWIWESRFPLYTGRSFFIMSFALILLYHYAALIPFSILSGTNLNYTMCPPKQVAPVAALGKWYRPPTTAACVLLAWLIRYVVIEAFVRLMGRSTAQLARAHAAKNAAAVAPEASPDDPSRTVYADVELDEGVIVTNSRKEAELIRRASTEEVEIEQLHEPRTISSLDRLMQPNGDPVADAEEEVESTHAQHHRPVRRSSRSSSRASTVAQSASSKKKNKKTHAPSSSKKKSNAATKHD